MFLVSPGLGAVNNLKATLQLSYMTLYLISSKKLKKKKVLRMKECIFLTGRKVFCNIRNETKIGSQFANFKTSKEYKRNVLIALVAYFLYHFFFKCLTY